MPRFIIVGYVWQILRRGALSGQIYQLKTGFKNRLGIKKVILRNIYVDKVYVKKLDNMSKINNMKLKLAFVSVQIKILLSKIVYVNKNYVWMLMSDKVDGEIVWNNLLIKYSQWSNCLKKQPPEVFYKERRS